MTRISTAAGAFVLCLHPALVHAQEQQVMNGVDPACADVQRPSDYDEQVQQDFLSNYFALSSTYSSIHGPIPHEAGTGSAGLDLAGIPPLGCEKRYALDWTKTEETNISPVMPKIQAAYALPVDGKVVPYASLAVLPPIAVRGARTFVSSGAFGAGMPIGDQGLSVGLRGHFTMMRTLADVVPKASADEEDYDDLYVASTFGFDALVGTEVGMISPYASLGFVDASTYAWIGDDGVVVNNLHPYFGPALAMGTTVDLDPVSVGAEIYAAPGGISTPDPSVDTVASKSRYGNLFTARVRVSYVFSPRIETSVETRRLAPRPLAPAPTTVADTTEPPGADGSVAPDDIDWAPVIDSEPTITP